MAKILVIDDDEQYPLMLAKILKKNNHDVTIANDGKGALSYCKAEKFDLIITDIFMPNMDGLELIMNLTKTGSQVPVIAISGGRHLFSSNDVLFHALTFGAKITLTKPFSDAQLLDAVSSIV